MCIRDNFISISQTFEIQAKKKMKSKEADDTKWIK